MRKYYIYTAENTKGRGISKTDFSSIMISRFFVMGVTGLLVLCYKSKYYK